MLLKIFSGNMESETAGLSPTGKRIELFLAGCRIARQGNPCPGCFNKLLWSDKDCYIETPDETIEYIKSVTDNKYITIVGGEPLDQIEALLELCKKLQDDDFHVCIISHYTFEEIVLNHDYRELLYYINMLIDGRYDENLRIFDTDLRPGVHHVIGSSNQRIWWKNKKDNIWENVTKKEDLVEYYSN